MEQISGNVNNNVLIGQPTKSQEIAFGKRPKSWNFEVFAIYSEAIGREVSFLYQIKRFGFMYVGSIKIF